MKELIKALNQKAKTGQLLVFVAKTRHLVNATSVSKNGNAIQIWVDENPGAVAKRRKKGTK